MSLAYQIDAGRRLVITTASGVLSDADLIAHQQCLVQDAQFDGGYGQLVDPTDIRGGQVTFETLMSIAARSPWPETTRRALVVNGGIVTSIADLYRSELGAAAPNVKLFQSRDDALDWLELRGS